MMRKPTGHKEKHSNRYEISHNHSIDGTSARTRPYSFHEIMLKRKNKKLSGHIQDQRLSSEIISSKESESISGHVDSDRHRHSEHKSMREDKIVKESYNNQRRSVIVSDNVKDRRKERDAHVHEKRRNQCRLSDDFDNVHEKRHGKDFTVKERDRNVERNRVKSEHGSRQTQNGYEKLESRKRHERDKRRSSSPSSRSNKQRLYDVKDLEKDKPRIDSNERVLSINGSSNKSKRNDTTSSKLGGYSPRKRRNEAVVKTTPSPIDLPPVKIEAKVFSSLSSFNPDLVSLNKVEVTKPHEAVNVVVSKPNFGVLFPSMMNASVDSVQLTQATRPKRRIYVENLPSSATEGGVVEWLSGYLRPFGVNHVQSTSPCISCIVNKDKGQALVEFLTPEDASTALSFDGKSFFGNVVKIRRPKDYVETTTGGVSEKQNAPAAVSVKNIVQDSPNKIFIGGISRIITSKMLMEIASAFGPLKAYHFEANPDLDSPYAFLEYVDQSVTIKACVGLNGMKLGGQLLTVTQTTPHSSVPENQGDHPFYGTPAHAQPLLEKQTQVLKLNNVVDPQSLSSLSEQELDEILEDVRLECARFGMVKSINIIKPTTGLASPQPDATCKESGSEHVDQNNSHDDDVAAAIGGANDPEEADVAVGANGMEENSNQISCGIDQLELNDNKGDNDGGTKNKEMEKDESFEDGCVLVEYKRIEASAMAAHCLHGRVFDGRIVSVEFVPYDVYCGRFEK